MARSVRNNSVLAVLALIVLALMMMASPPERLSPAAKHASTRGRPQTASGDARSGQRQKFQQEDEQDERRGDTGAILDKVAAGHPSESVRRPVLEKQYSDMLTAHLTRIFSIEGMPIDNMWNLAHATRLHRELFVMQRRAASSNTQQPIADTIDLMLSKVEKAAYPWLKTSVADLQSSFKPKSRGLVYTTGRHHAHFAYISIKGIRKLGSDIPVKIVYGGENDLPKAYRDVFEELDGVTTVDIRDKLNWDVATPEGWSIKPFAMLLADFEEVMFVDSDVFFFQKPDLLFDDEGYQKTGSLFFHDRTLFPDPNAPSHVWFKSFVPDPSETGQALRHWQGITQHEQESGVVVVNKGVDSSAIIGLLATCALNVKSIRDGVVYHKVHGDKETFWMSYEMAGQEYTFMPGNGGVIGFRSKTLKEEKAVCGGLLHTDRDNKPLWFNGGLEVDKHNVPDLLMDFEAYHIDDDAKDISWRFPNKEHKEGFCMYRKEGLLKKYADPIPISQRDIATGNWLVETQLKYQNDKSMEAFWKGTA
ncbi:hypothetical protein RI367_001343 [Sorochytrium milnesiophthora]